METARRASEKKPAAARGLRHTLSYARSLVLTNPLIYFYTVVCGTFSLAGSLLDSRGRWQHFWARAWSWLILRTSGIRVRVTGLEHLPGGAAVFCSNHPSAMDIPIFLAHLPVQFRFLAKRSLFHVPFLGWHLRRSGHISVDRGRPREALKGFEQAAQKIRAGLPVVMFPEGTRSRTPGMLPFKGGGFYLAVLAGVPIVPITLNGTRAVLKPHTLHVRAGQTEMIIHPPVSTEGLTHSDVPALSERVREQILSRFHPEED